MGHGLRALLAWHAWWWLLVWSLSGCGVFKNTTRSKQLDRVDARVQLDVARIDTSKRLVLETWDVDGVLPGQSFTFGGKVVDGQLRIVNPLFDLSIGLDSMGKVLSGALVLPPSGMRGSGQRLTLEQKGESERDNSKMEQEAESKGDDRTGTSSWKGVWVWLGGIALVLVFIYVLVRYFFKR